MVLQNLQLVMNNASESLDENQLVSEVDKKIKQSEAILQSFHRQWFVNIAMRRGLQYIQTHHHAKAIVQPPESESKVRMIANKMQGIHQNRLAKLTKDLPKLDVLPASAQEDDKDLARKGTRLLDWLWNNQKMPQKIMDLSSWMIDCGSAFLLVYWDHNKGPKIPVYQRHEGPITGEEDYKVDEGGYILDEKGERILQDVSLGDVCIDVIPPFQVVNDGLSDDLDKSLWLVLQQAMSLGEIQRRWPERGMKVKAEKDIGTRAYYQRRLLSLSGNQSEFFGSGSESGSDDMATVKTYWEKASAKYPQGRQIVTAGGILLEAGPMPYGHGEEYPLVKFDDVSVSGSFWGIGTMENLIPCQKGYNRTLSQILENANNMGNIKLMAPKNHGMSKEAFDDSGSEVIEFNQGFEPHQLQPIDLPPYVVNLLQIYDKNFEDLSGQHEVSRAQVPPGVKSGRAIAALQEQDDTRLAPAKLSLNRGLEQIGIKALKLYEEFQDEERAYQIIGETVNDIHEVKVSREEIQSMNKDVRVQTENLIASHKRLQQEQVLEMYEQGLFGDPLNPAVRRKVLKMMEFGNVAELFDDLDQDLGQAKHENELFLKQENLKEIPDPKTKLPLFSLEAFEFEDHETHIQEHNKLRKSPRYRNMTEMQRRAIDMHVEKHEFFKQKNEVPAPPGPPPGATPPPPGPPPPPPPPPPRPKPGAEAMSGPSGPGPKGAPLPF